MKFINGLILKLYFLTGWIPVLCMIVLFLLAFQDVSDDKLQRAGIDFGTSVATVLFFILVVFNPKLKYCSITKLSTLGLLANIILYKIGYLISYETYSNAYTIVECSTVCVVWIFINTGYLFSQWNKFIEKIKSDLRKQKR